MPDCSLKKLIESLVEEVLQETAPEAPKDAPYGKYLFAPYRLDLEDHEGKERNTDDEEKFLKALSSNYSGGPGALGSMIDQIKPLVKKGHYKKILAPPNTKVYRYITNVKPLVAARFLRLEKKDIVEKPGKGWYVEGGGTMQPGGSLTKNSGIHSWATRLDPEWLDDDIVWGPLKNGEVAMLLVANTSNTSNFFFINPTGIQDVAELPRFAYYQHEVISHGPVQFDEAVFFTAPEGGNVDFPDIWAELTRALGTKYVGYPDVDDS